MSRILSKNHLSTLLYQKNPYLCSILLLILKTLHIMAKKFKKHSFILEMGVYLLFSFYSPSCLTSLVITRIHTRVIYMY